MSFTPHKDKLLAAIANPKCKDDVAILREAELKYDEWISKTQALKTKGKRRVNQMVKLLNEYKDYLEVELIAKRGRTFIKRQKGQLKLDNSILEEFLIHLVDPKIISGLPKDFEIEKGPQTTFMSLCFRPAGITYLNDKPQVVLKKKDQDFTIGKSIYYKFSSSPTFEQEKTSQGDLYLSVFAAEIKVNYDKTMFQECVGTASRLKQGCPIAKYYALVEYLDMLPEDCRSTDIDNVFLLRKTKRLSVNKRTNVEEVEKQHSAHPIGKDVIWAFVQEIQKFVDAVWFDPDAALERGSFIEYRQ